VRIALPSAVADRKASSVMIVSGRIQWGTW
jgi:hypothetical protein